MKNDLPISLVAEILAIDQRLRSRLSKALPKGMELSHFSVLNHLAATKSEVTPAKLAASLNVTRGAITNTLSRLEANGHIHVGKDWEDARKKYVSITQAGMLAREMAIQAVSPVFETVAKENDEVALKGLIASLRKLRLQLG